jgi:protein-S-isoprenylcysteine O-methyltransferase Ste14
MPSPLLSRLDARAGRLYFAMQVLTGAAWWIGVATTDPVLLAVFDVPLFVIASLLVAVGVRWAVWIIVPWVALITAVMAVYATLTGLAGWGVLLMLAATAGSTAAGLLVWLGRLPTEWLLVGPFSFRPATATTTRAHITRSAVQIVVFWGLFLGVIPAIIVFFEQRWNLHLEFPTAVRWGGGILFVAAGALGLWSAYTMSTRGEGTPLPSAMARRLVVTGPYLFVRNPMAIAGIAQGVSVGLLAGSWLVVVYALSGSLIWNWIVRPLEEEDLEARFGAEYTAYARAVRCWIPQLRPFRAEREQSLTPR